MKHIEILETLKTHVRETRDTIAFLGDHPKLASVQDMIKLYSDLSAHKVRLKDYVKENLKALKVEYIIIRRYK